MTLRNTTESWGSPAKWLHWLMALGILGTMTLGVVMVNLPMSALKFELYAIHKSIGMTLLVLALLRISWRWMNPVVPVLPSSLPAYERRLAGWAHGLFYVLLFAMPISGYVINSAANFPLNVFGLVQVPNVVPESESVSAVATWVHASLFWFFAGLIAIHVAGALRHHFILKDGILLRMLPKRSSKET
ncbi:cytochrome b [Spiribacter sp. C176]|uniref:Cytochrome b n=1 Tax=Spiribacter salilacus TaxID=2664894 RepID=A0A6N7QPJ6_9GAMM|nr:cytochrome b [Spiribacter salilacus]MRH78311.1 cytochrome b [Spiribacter salilacus]